MSTLLTKWYFFQSILVGHPQWLDVWLLLGISEHLCRVLCRDDLKQLVLILDVRVVGVMRLNEILEAFLFHLSSSLVVLIALSILFLLLIVLEKFLSAFLIFLIFLPQVAELKTDKCVFQLFFQLIFVVIDFLQ